MRFDLLDISGDACNSRCCLCTLARQEKLEGAMHASAWLWGRLDHVRIQILANCQFDLVSKLADLTCLRPMLFTAIPVPVWKALVFSAWFALRFFVASTLHTLQWFDAAFHGIATVNWLRSRDPHNFPPFWISLLGSWRQVVRINLPARCCW